MKSDLVDLELFQFQETDAAILVWHDETERKKAVWLPKSQVEVEPFGNGVTVTMPEWLATEKGLV